MDSRNREKPSKRNCLTLQKKVEVIRTHEKNPRINVRELAERFECGKTQIAMIIKQKDSILSAYETNASTALVRATTRSSEYADINKALYDWYCLACSKNLYPNGPQLMEKARQIATALDKSRFKGSNGWLEKWKSRYNIKQFTISGESGDVSGVTVDAWIEKIPEILAGFAKVDILNLDETALWWRTLPTHGFGQKGKECKGGKKAKNRITICFIVNADGGKEKPIVIGKSENPRCFKRFDKALLPVTYHSQPKAWMSGGILEIILAKLNRRFVAANRKVALLLDNTGCHPDNIETKYSNIKIIFLPPNTTSRLQPLDLGIIQNFKAFYRKLFLRYIVSRIDECETVSDITKSLNLLTAVRWVALAWKEVKEQTVLKCFRKAGILCGELEDMQVVSRPYSDGTDPFADLDESDDLQQLIDRTLPEGQSCSAAEYIQAEEDVPVQMEYDDNWDATFIEGLAEPEDSAEPDEEDEDGGSDNEDEEPEVKVKKFSEAIAMLDDVKAFLDHRGCVEEATALSSVMDSVSSIKLLRSK